MFINQKKIKINKPKKYEKEFLQIGIAEWQDAFKKLDGNPSAFAMYLYLASNTNGYEKELSSVAFKNATGKTRSSYHRALELLSKNGYIYEDKNGQLNFATKPKEGLRKAIQNWEGTDAKVSKKDAKEECERVKSEIPMSQKENVDNPELNTQIDNKNNIDNSHIYSKQTRLKHLKEMITPSGQVLGKNGYWLEKKIPSLWEMDKDSQIKAITKNTNFNQSDAQIIVDSILSLEAHEKTQALFKKMALFDEE